MAWRTDNPLRSLSDDEQNKTALEVWETESMGGIKEDNNRLPQAVVYLLMLTILAAFLITFPLWGQRPTAATYAPYVALLDDPKVQALPNDEAKLEYIENAVREGGSSAAGSYALHPVDMNDLRAMKPSIEELKAQDARLDEYFVLGDRVVQANFEGNLRPNGTVVRKQPWWDLGYTIDIFYVIYFCLAVMIAVKRLPPYTWQPRHGHERVLSDEEVVAATAAEEAAEAERKERVSA